MIKFFVEAHNCCPIEQCHLDCMSLGYPTIYGVLLIIFISLTLTLIFKLLGKLHERKQKKNMHSNWN